MTERWDKLVANRDRIVDQILRRPREEGLSYKVMRYLTLGEHREAMPKVLIQAQEALLQELAGIGGGEP